MDVEQLSVEEGWKERIFGFLAVFLLYFKENLLIHVILIDVLVGSQKGFNSPNLDWIGQQFKDVIVYVVMYFAEYLPGKYFVDGKLKFLMFLLHKWEKTISWKIPLHFFEFRYQPIS